MTQIHVPTYFRKPVARIIFFSKIIIKLLEVANVNIYFILRLPL